MAQTLKQEIMEGGSKSVATQKAAPKTMVDLLVDPRIKAQMALALPKHMTADRLARIALTEVRKTPKLATCDQASFLGAIMQLAALGLEPGGALGHAYLIPFDKSVKVGNKWEKKAEVQLIIGYRGMLDLARRSGQILSLESRAIHANDRYEIELGLNSNITHKPSWEMADRGPVVFVYAVAKLKDGGTQFEVMSRVEIEAIRDGSQGYKAAVSAAEQYNKAITSPWETHFEEMAKKTVIRRLFKYLPVSIEIQQAVGLDEMADAGIAQQNAMLIDADYTVESSEQEGSEHASEALTAQEVHDAIAGATTADMLDQAESSIDMVPKGKQQELRDLATTVRGKFV